MNPITFEEAARLTEPQAREYLELIRWPNGPVCPRQGCGSTDVTKLRGKSHRQGLYKCNARKCRKPFTVSVGTIFEDSHIALAKWVLAFHMMAASKKGVSALQLMRTLSLGSYRSAWHMAHRIRYAMSQEPLAGLLKGTVEIDETFVGGRPRNPSKSRDPRWDRKTPVMAFIERDGGARTLKVDRLDSKTMQQAALRRVDPSARIMTDEHPSYGALGWRFKGGHGRVKHLRREYVRRGTDHHINTAESFFALLKRGVHGTFHHISRKHTGRYADEFAFRWTHRKVSDGMRAWTAMRQAEVTCP